MPLNIRLFHLKQIGKRKKEELQNEQGRNGNLAEGDRTGDDRPGQTETGGRIQEDLETHSIEGGEHSTMEPMTYKQMAEITGKSTRTLRWFSKQHSIAPITPGGAYKPATFDPAPFLEHYAADKTKPRKKSGPKPKKDKVIQDKPGEETQAHYEEAAEYPAVAPPLPVLTPELIYAFKDVFGPTGTISVLRNNYGLNDIS